MLVQSKSLDLEEHWHLWQDSAGLERETGKLDKLFLRFVESPSQSLAGLFHQVNISAKGGEERKE